jgi:curved DNA binding protein
MSAPAASAAAAAAAPAKDVDVSEDAASEKKEEPVTIADVNVLNKYKEAARIAQEALALVLRAASNGVAVIDLAKASDELIVDRTSKLYANKKTVTKGVAFPTCIGVNKSDTTETERRPKKQQRHRRAAECQGCAILMVAFALFLFYSCLLFFFVLLCSIVGHFCPMEKDQDQPILHTGDIVKVDLGVHIDGFVALVAQTFAVPAQPGSAQSTPLTGRAADAYAACLVAADAALKSLRVGRKNQEVSELISKVASEFGVTPVQGVLSQTLTRHRLDGDKAILNRLDPEQRIDDATFALNDVWGIDIVMSTGEGKPKEVDNRQTTIYKRNAAVNYSLKTATSRGIFSEILQKYSQLPFSLRYLTDANKARFGIAEAREHDLVYAYPVLHEKEGEVVAQVKFTVLLTASGPQRITGPIGGLEFNPNVVQASKKFKDFGAELQTALKALTIAPAAAAGSGDAAAAAAAPAEGAEAGAAGANAAKNKKKKEAQAKKKAAEAAAAAAAK